jgi:LPS-assembly protein
MDLAATRPRNRRTRLKAWILAAFLALVSLLPDAFLPPAAHAQESTSKLPSLMRLDPGQPWQIEADRINYDQIRDEYIAEGHVVIWKQDRSITADTVRYNVQTKMAYAEGHVVLTAGSDILTGDYLENDMESEQGYITNGTIFIAKSNYHIQSDRIEKTGPESYTIGQGVVTTCDGALPDWKIAGRDVTIKDDGSVTAWNAVVYARDMPFFYYPYIDIPPPGKPTTGLLMPQGGYSERKGAFATQPFYWAIDDRSDATFYLEYMGERGWKPGVEYRYFLTREAKGAIMFDYFHDEQVDDGTDKEKTKLYGFKDPVGDILRPNRDRYWFRMSHDNPLPEGFLGRLELDIASDQDYLREFKTGYMGFEDSRAYFNQFFGRTLDDYNAPIRTNRLLVSKSWASFSLNAEADWYDNVNKGANWKETPQILPQVSLIAPKQQLGTSPFFGTLNTQYIDYWKDRGYGVQRTDMWPRVYYPIGLPPYLTIEPSAGLRETVWNQYKSDAADAWSDDQYFHRELYDARLALFTNFSRSYNVDQETLKKVRHAVRPELSYTYVPDVDQEDLPLIDTKDRIINRRRIAYSLTNTLTSKSMVAPQARAARAQETQPGEETLRETILTETPSDYDYRDVMRLKVGQYYDLAREYHPFSPVFGKLQFFPVDKIKLETEAAYNIYDQLYDRYNIALSLSARQKDRLTVSYRYDRDPLAVERLDDYDTQQEIFLPTPTDNKKIDYLLTELRLGLTERFTLITSYEGDFEDGSTTYGAGFVYDSQCWTFETLFHYGTDDIGFEFRIRLKGIGEFGI